MDFSIQINGFLSNGRIPPQIDDGGNIYLNNKSTNFNQNYVSMPLQLSIYNTSSVETYYPIEFTEFVSTILETSMSASDLTSQISQLQAVSSSLSMQLNNLLSAQLDNNNSANTQASQQVIINLRIALGQGSSVSDFSATFPYSPLSGAATTTTASQVLLPTDIISSATTSTSTSTSTSTTTTVDSSSGSSAGIPLNKTAPYLLGWPPKLSPSYMPSNSSYSTDPYGYTLYPDGIAASQFPFISCKIVSINKTSSDWNTAKNASLLTIGNTITFFWVDGRPPKSGIYRWFVYGLQIVINDVKYVTNGSESTDISNIISITDHMANDIYVVVN